MADHKEENTLVIIKPDSFWRQLDRQIESRIRALGLEIAGECTLAQGENHPEEKWREFYFPAVGDKPAILIGTAKYMAFGPVKVIHLKGADAVQKVRKAVGATRPWQAEPGTIRGDFWAGAEEANAAHRPKFQQPGDDKFLFNLIHASDSEKSFEREVLFFPKLKVSQPLGGVLI
jgi:nucleoside-diphosphate kinase